MRVWRLEHRTELDGPYMGDHDHDIDLGTYPNRPGPFADGLERGKGGVPQGMRFGFASPTQLNSWWFEGPSSWEYDIVGLHKEGYVVRVYDSAEVIPLKSQVMFKPGKPLGHMSLPKWRLAHDR